MLITALPNVNESTLIVSFYLLISLYGLNTSLSCCCTYMLIVKSLSVDCNSSAVEQDRVVTTVQHKKLLEKTLEDKP